jgi:hypothetical protein
MAQSLVSSGSYTLSSPNTLTSSLSAGNPGHVFYFPGDLTISGAGTYDATLIVRGKVTISAPSSSSISINRQQGFPAMMADGSLNISSAKNASINFNGVVYLGGGTVWGTSSLLVGGAAVRINGALLMPSGKTLGSIASTSTGLTVTYTPANVDVINLTTAIQPGTGVKFVSWSQ